MSVLFLLMQLQQECDIATHGCAESEYKTCIRGPGVFCLLNFHASPEATNKRPPNGRPLHIINRCSFLSSLAAEHSEPLEEAIPPDQANCKFLVIRSKSKLFFYTSPNLGKRDRVLLQYLGFLEEKPSRSK
eukprot:g690.t1